MNGSSFNGFATTTKSKLRAASPAVKNTINQSATQQFPDIFFPPAT
jgi:hypothetical protein